MTLYNVMTLYVALYNAIMPLQCHVAVTCVQTLVRGHGVVKLPYMYNNIVSIHVYTNLNNCNKRNVVDGVIIATAYM